MGEQTLKPPPFHYHAPTSVEEAVGLLHELADQDAKVLAGGQSLMPLLNMRLARPRHLVDINGLAEIDYLKETAEGGVAIGALTRQRTLERSPVVAERLPLLAEAVPLIGDRTIRCRGTLGGSLAHADPAAELGAVVVALDAEMVVWGPGGTRTVPASEFFVSYLTTALGPDELLVEVRFPPSPHERGCAFVEFARQHGAFAIVAAAAVLDMSDGHMAGIRVGLAGVGPTPIRARDAETLLVGRAPGREVFAEAAACAAGECEPDGDVHGSAQYRREMAEVYVRRALELAAERAGWSV